MSARRTEPGQLASAVYEGRVRHRRFRPHGHAFEYPLFFMYLDLDELDDVLGPSRLASTRRPALVRYRRADYLGDPDVPLERAVRDLVAERTGRRPAGPVRLLTHLRYWGLAFNPVSVYYCFARDGETLEHVVAEVTNTPWGERHCYVLTAGDAAEARPGVATWHLPKVFHVSPFWDMEHDYRWTFTTPGERLAVHMENYPSGRIDEGSNGKLFDATLTLRRTRALTPAAILATQVRYPLMTARVVGWIYLQAFKLWRRETPFHPHPRHRPASAVVGQVDGAES